MVIQTRRQQQEQHHQSTTEETHEATTKNQVSKSLSLLNCNENQHDVSQKRNDNIIEIFKYEEEEENKNSLNQRKKRTYMKDNKSSVQVAEPPINNNELSLIPFIPIKENVKKRTKNDHIVKVEDIESISTKCIIPKGFQEVWEAILEMRHNRDAPVDIMGCDKLADLNANPQTQRFHHLIAVFLSSQTSDKATSACMARLKKFGLTPQHILETSEEELASLLRGVSFHNTKANHIMIEEFQGDIPPTYDTLCNLPGIGPKMALIAMNSAWGKVEGIAVDVHVHRICNRLGWVKTKTPEQTCLELARAIPRDLWEEFNTVLVGFGQQRCKAINPLCDICLAQSQCPAAKNFMSQNYSALLNTEAIVQKNKKKIQKIVTPALTAPIVETNHKRKKSCK